MPIQFDKVYQFRIILNDTDPPVWRLIRVPETYTFWEFHVAIQDVMGWDDCHLHEFRLVSPKTGTEGCIGIPGEENDLLPGWEQKIAEWFSMQNSRACYLYDFGDSWEHTVVLEKILPREKEVNYPVCVDGSRACPPENCGGIPGYEEICQGSHEFQENYRGYHPERFDPKEVCFDDPKGRLKAVRTSIK